MKTTSKLFIYFSLLLFIVLNPSCSKDNNGDNSSSSSIAVLLRSPSYATVGSNTLTLETYVYRDFMPPGEPNGSPLIGICRVVDSSGTALSDSLELLKLFVIYNEDVWIADYTDKRWIEPNGVEGMARNGPKWGPNVLVDIVSEFRANGQLYRILARDQEIEAAY